jgi:hypothetical protein
MEQYFTKTFFRFFFGFLVIIAVAFGVLIVTSHLSPSPGTIDNTATPQ